MKKLGYDQPHASHLDMWWRGSDRGGQICARYGCISFRGSGYARFSRREKVTLGPRLGHAGEASAPKPLTANSASRSSSYGFQRPAVASCGVRYPLAIDLQALTSSEMRI